VIVVLALMECWPKTIPYHKATRGIIRLKANHPHRAL
jgi:hypothetical protein